MRIKILMLGTDAASMMADSQLLKEQGFLVMGTSDLQNVNELTEEVKPDVVFFDPNEPNNHVANACDIFMNDTHFINIPVILTLSDDEEYRVTAERTNGNNNKATIVDNIIDAVHIALDGNGILPSPNGNKRIPIPINEARLFA